MERRRGQYFEREILMHTHSVFRALGAISVALACFPAGAQTVQSQAQSSSNEQLEADYRVIAARCGSPAFEKAFFKESQAAVRAGLISKRASPAEVEKTIAALRRSPFVLVAVSADCPAQLARLKDVQKARSGLVKSTRRH